MVNILVAVRLGPPLDPVSQMVKCYRDVIVFRFSGAMRNLSSAPASMHGHESSAPVTPPLSSQQPPATSKSFL